MSSWTQTKHSATICSNSLQRQEVKKIGRKFPGKEWSWESGEELGRLENPKRGGVGGEVFKDWLLDENVLRGAGSGLFNHYLVVAELTLKWRQMVERGTREEIEVG